jgi:hypothetical protein
LTLPIRGEQQPRQPVLDWRGWSLVAPSALAAAYRSKSQRAVVPSACEGSQALGGWRLALGTDRYVTQVLDSAVASLDRAIVVRYGLGSVIAHAPDRSAPDGRSRRG